MVNLWHTPIRWRILSVRAAKGLTEILTGELARRVALLNEKAINAGRTLPALVILRMISLQYYANTRGEAMYRLNELQRVERKGDRIEDFQITWQMVLAGQAYDLPVEVLHELYEKQVKDFHGIAMDMQYYRRLDDDHKDKSYDWLVATVERYIALKRMERNKAALHKGIGPTLHAPNAAAPKTGKPKKSKGKWG